MFYGLEESKVQENERWTDEEVFEPVGFSIDMYGTYETIDESDSGYCGLDGPRPEMP